ncbi:YceI family protein [Mucilaginibacter paludis]|uniref:YceI family protein n=1 Tax=Mucilaginibacter paludis DSM 18603 TaxID=714943 RepID=H1YD66_9SPHI|nr:YceI family protein [Mucilaginibacter paludis]EHQ27092.1 YceI family protein [Mucilaginibacter paludis DSM 18603]
MKTKLFNRTIKAIPAIIASIIFLATPQLKAQTIYRLSPGKDVAIKVLGSSNVHDWTMTSTKMESQGDFKFDGEQLQGLSGLSFSVDAKSLKSEHSGMDDRTYKAIKADQYPKITYKLSSAVISTIQKNKYLIKTKGELTITGVPQLISMDVTAVVNPDNSITCTGAEKIKLTDFKIQPPSFMLGAMKVANDLTIQYTLNYKK